MKAYLLAHWRGELSLRRAFLLNGLLAYVVLIFGLLALQEIFITIYLFYASFVVVFVWEIWAAVGIFRSAHRVWRAPDPFYPHPTALRLFIGLAVAVTIAGVVGTLSDVPLLFK